jgi:hypothetical protein
MDEKPSLMHRFLQSGCMHVIVGLFMLAFSGFFYNQCTKFEAGEIERLPMPGIAAIVYESLGKWPLIAFGGLIGLLYVSMGVKLLVVGEKSNDQLLGQ